MRLAQLITSCVLLLVALVSANKTKSKCAIKRLNYRKMIGKWKLLTSKNNGLSEYAEALQQLLVEFKKEGNGFVLVVTDNNGQEVGRSFKYVPQKKSGMFIGKGRTPEGKQIDLPMKVVAFKPNGYLITVASLGKGAPFFGVYVSREKKLSASDVQEMAKGLHCVGVTSDMF